MIDRFTELGFDVPDVVAVFEDMDIPSENGQDYAMNEATVSRITSTLFGERAEIR